ncbi:ScbR family autoregulator-binding transcription factor [Streptomyces sp. NPDC048192]|jgi:AcrR family transcriptional regulator|uniref:ScbR family autoregulator-binding transcription factor n=1 Tax=Streptomyces sp. NPDC048192 TaxID=3365510 RepID=UPI003719E215
MAMQDRAIRTRRKILSAAAEVFESRGYRSATISEVLNTAGVTKGALYFHFQSKEDLAQGVLSAQDQMISLPERPSKVQELVDVVMLHAHRLQTDPMVRAAVRLAMDQTSHGLDRRTPFLKWTGLASQLLEEARARGELLPHVEPQETADVLTGAFAGIQSMSHAMSDYADLMQRSCALLRHILPSVVMPALITALDLSETRGSRVFAEVQASLAEVAEVEVAIS